MMTDWTLSTTSLSLTSMTVPTAKVLARLDFFLPLVLTEN